MSSMLGKRRPTANSRNSAEAKRAKAMQADKSEQENVRRVVKATQERAYNQAIEFLKIESSEASQFSDLTRNKANEIGANLSEAIWQYAKRPSGNPELRALDVFNKIAKDHPYYLFSKGRYGYALPKTEINILEDITSGEKYDSGQIFERMIQNETRLGKELIQLYKALIAALKGLHSYLNVINKKGYSAEMEIIVRFLFANLIILLVKKHLKELHNMEVRLHLIRTGQDHREGPMGTDCSQYTIEGKSIQLLDSTINNVLNTMIALWPQLAIEYHLNPGVIVTDRDQLASEPEILGSFESAEAYVRGPASQYLASHWAKLDKPYEAHAPTLPAEVAASIARNSASGVGLPANTRSIKNIFNRENVEKNIAEQKYANQVAESIRDFAGSVVDSIAENARYLFNLVHYREDSQFSEDEKQTEEVDIHAYLQNHRFPEKGCIQMQEIEADAEAISEEVAQDGKGIKSRKQSNKKLRKTQRRNRKNNRK